MINKIVKAYPISVDMFLSFNVIDFKLIKIREFMDRRVTPDGIDSFKPSPSYVMKSYTYIHASSQYKCTNHKKREVSSNPTEVVHLHICNLYEVKRKSKGEGEIILTMRCGWAVGWPEHQCRGEESG